MFRFKRELATFGLACLIGLPCLWLYGSWVDKSRTETGRAFILEAYALGRKHESVGEPVAHFKAVSGGIVCSECGLFIGSLSLAGERFNQPPFSWCPYCRAALDHAVGE